MNLTEQVSKAQVKNILAKLKAGKTISRQEQRAVEAYESTGSTQVVAQREAARHYGVSQAAIARWVRLGCPMTSYEAIDRWRADRVDEEPTNANTAKLKKTLLEVELLDLKIQQQRGELVSKALMREQGQRVGALIVAEFAAMANDAPGQLAGADEATIRDRLEARFAVLIGRLRAAIEEMDAAAPVG